MTDPALRCRVCGEVIGVYEPLIVLREGAHHETSKAAADDGQLRGELYHRDCYPLRSNPLAESEPANGHVGEPDGASKDPRQ